MIFIRIFHLTGKEVLLCNMVYICTYFFRVGIGGSIIDFELLYENEGATWGSMPFFANSIY